MANSNISKMANMEFDLDNDCVFLRLGHGIFSLNDIETAVRSVISRASAQMITHGNGFTVELRPKESQNLEEIGWEFNAMLINNAFQRLKERKTDVAGCDALHEIERNLAELEQESMDDPLGISKLWEEA